MQNLLPNTQFEVCTALLPVAKQLPDGSGSMPPIAVSGYTQNVNAPTISTGNTGALKVGDLGLFSSAADATLQQCTLEVIGGSFAVNSSFQVILPRFMNSGPSQACAFQPVTVGDLTSSTGAGPDGWNKNVGLQLWIEDNAQNLYSGAMRGVGARITGNQDYFCCYLAADKVWMLQGQSLSFGVPVRQRTKGGQGTARAYINIDGNVTYGQPISGNGAYEWAAVDCAVPANAGMIVVGVEFDGVADDVYYVCKPIAAQELCLRPFYYSRPRGEHVTLTVKTSPWVGVSGCTPNAVDAGGTTYGFLFCLYQESNGAIAPSVIALEAQFERRTANVGDITAWREQAGNPTKYGMQPIKTTIANTLDFGAGRMNLKYGNAWFYSPNPSVSFAQASIDINGVWLND